VSAEYLAGRKLELAEGMSGRVLRHHPRCPWRNEADELVLVPALLALFRDVRTDEPTAILRRALTADGRKIGKPRYLGPMAGCAVKLTANKDVCQGLHVGEGVETMLAAMMLGFAPAWALGGTGNLQAFPVLSGIDALTIIVDHDAHGAGQRAASECFDCWTEAGREVWCVLPDGVGVDLNDIVAGGG
jgi:putative DNA primase/helicase